MQIRRRPITGPALLGELAAAVGVSRQTCHLWAARKAIRAKWNANRYEIPRRSFAEVVAERRAYLAAKRGDSPPLAA